MIEPDDHAGFRALLGDWISREQHSIREPKAFARWFAYRDMVALWHAVVNAP